VQTITEDIKGFFVLWGIIILANQLIIFGGCFAIYCIIAAVPHTFIIAVVLSYLLKKHFPNIESNENDTHDKTKSTSQFEQTQRKTNRPSQKKTRHHSQDFNSVDMVFKEPFKKPDNDPLKQRGDGFELHIGRKFELKRELVIYNGLIRGYEDQGVDVIIISKATESLHLIQCKHWRKLEFTQDHLKKIYSDLNNYRFDFHQVPSIAINQYLSIKRDEADILATVNESLIYSKIRKTLYLSSKNVISINVWPLLEEIKENIYRYKGMKIVFHRI
jgi:hypothetical protein